MGTNDAAEGIGDEVSLGSGYGSVGSFLKVDAMSKSADGGIASALDWLRGQTTEQKDEKVGKSDDVAAEPVEVRPLSAEEKRANEMNDALAWLRNNEAADVEDVDLPSFEQEDMKTYDHVSDAEKKSREMKDALSWMREKSPGD